MDQIGIDSTGDVPSEVLTADTLASDVRGLQHSMQQMERSDAEMAAMLAHPQDHGLDDDDVHELQVALEENVGVMERKRALLAKLARALEEALQASGLAINPETHHAEPTAPPIPAASTGTAHLLGPDGQVVQEDDTHSMDQSLDGGGDGVYL